MKILFLNEYAKPHIVSGAERSMLALSSAIGRSSFGRKKIKVYTLSPNLSPQPKGSVLKGRTLLDLKFPFPFKINPGQTLSPIIFNNPIFWLYVAIQTISIVKAHQVNLIHVHGKYIQPAAIIASWLTKIPVVTTVRDFKFLCPLALCYTHQQKKCSFSYFINKEIPFYLNNYTKNKLLKPVFYPRLVLAKLWQYVLKWFLNQSNQVIAVSPQLAVIYQTAGIKNTIGIYNLPPLKQISSKKSKLTNTIISIGKLSYGKGTDSLLKAMQLLPKIKLIIAGDKNISLKQDFPKNVDYLGKISHDQALSLFKKADVFIINSRWPEPLSRAGLEALSFGLPIIASNRGGNQKLVKNNGYLVNPDKTSDIVKAIKSIFNKDLQKLSKNSHLLLSTRFSREKIIQQHLNLYNNLI
ncbi:MAG: glycosyltransferase family 4 protein [Candidatus Beckwithbacteria bacterium]|nr:glycosyltransferase family 4 protein [Patescibacteria group bacterium]